MDEESELVVFFQMFVSLQIVGSQSLEEYDSDYNKKISAEDKSIKMKCDLLCSGRCDLLSNRGDFWIIRRIWTLMLGVYRDWSQQI